MMENRFATICSCCQKAMTLESNVGATKCPHCDSLIILEANAGIMTKDGKHLLVKDGQRMLKKAVTSQGKLANNNIPLNKDDRDQVAALQKNPNMKNYLKNQSQKGATAIKATKKELAKMQKDELVKKVNDQLNSDVKDSSGRRKLVTIN